MLSLVQLAWVCGMAAVFLLGLDQFLFSAGLGPPPKYWIVGTFAVSAVLFLPGFRAGRWLAMPVVRWAIFYMVASMLWVGVADNMKAALDGLLFAITTVLFVFMGTLAFPRVRNRDGVVTAMLWFCLWLAVASVALEYFAPHVFIFADAGMGIPGRAAGVYLNPNTAGQALILILACLLPRIGRAAGMAASLLALIGVAMTFSRGAALSCLLLIAFAALRGYLPRVVLFLIGLAAVGVALLGGLIFEFLSGWIDPASSNTLNRLEWMLGLGGLTDFSAGERSFVSYFAWSQFLESPWLGHGLGYTWVWSAGVSTHNVVLRHLVEYGLLGALILPSLLIAAVRSRNHNADSVWLWMVVAVCGLLSLFSHNMLEQGSFMFGLLIACIFPSSVPARQRSGRSTSVLPPKSFGISRART